MAKVSCFDQFHRGGMRGWCGDSGGWVQVDHFHHFRSTVIPAPRRNPKERQYSSVVLGSVGSPHVPIANVSCFDQFHRSRILDYDGDSGG